MLGDHRKLPQPWTLYCTCLWAISGKHERCQFIQSGWLQKIQLSQMNRKILKHVDGVTVK